uniref:Transmembrane domain-containing protein n=1 Tax=Spironucleus salmonicida TaxID=348837 RepID=V6LRP1_9EUKA|eukprot:EST47327.1 Transmembrane domain-containing protein [Spironucleus salmonicida]
MFANQRFIQVNIDLCTHLMCHYYTFNTSYNFYALNEHIQWVYRHLIYIFLAPFRYNYICIIKIALIISIPSTIINFFLAIQYLEIILFFSSFSFTDNQVSGSFLVYFQFTYQSNFKNTKLSIIPFPKINFLLLFTSLAQHPPTKLQFLTPQSYIKLTFQTKTIRYFLALFMHQHTSFPIAINLITLERLFLSLESSDTHQKNYNFYALKRSYTAL